MHCVLSNANGFRPVKKTKFNLNRPGPIYGLVPAYRKPTLPRKTARPFAASDSSILSISSADTFPSVPRGNGVVQPLTRTETTIGGIDNVNDYGGYSDEDEVHERNAVVAHSSKGIKVKAESVINSVCASNS